MERALVDLNHLKQNLFDLFSKNVNEKYDYVIIAALFTLHIDDLYNFKIHKNDVQEYLNAYEKNYRKYYGIDIWKDREKYIK